jgi:hypothetical protein
MAEATATPTETRPAAIAIRFPFGASTTGASSSSLLSYKISICPISRFYQLLALLLLCTQHMLNLLNFP